MINHEYTLITVPNQENLTENLAVCACCGCRFHVWGHLYSFAISAINSM